MESVQSACASFHSFESICATLQYSLCQKKRTFNPDFFCGPPGGRGPKIHMVDHVIDKIDYVNFWPPLPKGGGTKNGIKCAFLLTQTVEPHFNKHPWDQGKLIAGVGSVCPLGFPLQATP